MIVIKRTEQTEVNFYSNLLTKGQSYTGGRYDIIDDYTGDVLVTNTVTLSNAGFKHRFNIAETDVSGLVDNRRYDLVVYEGSDEVFRDNAIATDQNVSQNDEEKFSWNVDKYTFLARPEANKYKTLTR